MNLMEWAQQEIFGNTLATWAIGFAVFLIAWTVLLFVRRFLSYRVRKLADGTQLLALDVTGRLVGATRGWFLIGVSLFVGSRFWELSTAGDSFSIKGVIILLLLQAGIWGSRGAVAVIEARRKEDLVDNRGAVAAMDILSFVVRVVIWTLVLLLVLDNLGINITALVAGLGVGGIAVALAAQNILGDLFASLSIVLDKPFVVGDFLIVGEHLGTVERVGIKTTRLRSLSGEQLIFSNNDLLGSRIRNYGRMFERRVVFSIGVTYQTSAADLKRIPQIIRDAVEAQDSVRFDRAHFRSFGDFALLFEIVYFVTSSDYAVYMNVQQAINLAIFEEFESAGIEFAYPTQTLHVTQSATPSPADIA